MTQTMQAAVITHYGQKQPQITQVPIPTVMPTDVLVQISAASLNPVDFKIMSGGLRPLLHYQFPLVVGNDFAGRVVQVGNQVRQFKVGDRVYGRPDKSRIGTWASLIAVAETDIARTPDNLTDTDAAALPLVGLTSYQALHDIMAVQPGDRVLIQAGSGGVGTVAIQIAKRLGATVVTTTSRANFPLVQSLGADEIIDYHQDAFEQVLAPVDFVFDTLGGDNLTKAFQIIKPGGKVVSVSGLPNARFAREYGLPWWQQKLFGLATWRLTRLAKRASAQYHFLFMKPSGKELARLTRWVESGQLRPVVDHILPFSQLEQAVTDLQSGHAKGKIILEMAENPDW